MFLKNKKGQSTLEYALLIAAVVAGLVMMQIYVKRGFGGKIKKSVDDMGEQYDPVAYSSNFTTNSHSMTNDTVASKVTTSTLVDNQTNDRTGSETVTAWTEGEDLNRVH